MVMRSSTFVACVATGASALKYSGLNAPSLPGNWNFPGEGTFGADVAKSLPDINIRYHYPTSFLKGQSEIDSALGSVPVSSGGSSDNGALDMLLGMAHSPRPTSFMKVDPLTILPPGVASGVAASSDDSTPYTLNLHPPEADAAEMNQRMNSLAKIEDTKEQEMEMKFATERQSMIDDEVQMVHELVASHRRSSFLQSMYRPADYEVVLHAPSESASDVTASTNAILKVEGAKASKAAASDAALKNALLSAEIAKIAAIVAGSA
jgi:hypothetical protein